jgi:regulator of replication initiation timing
LTTGNNHFPTTENWTVCLPLEKQSLQKRLERKTERKKERKKESKKERKKERKKEEHILYR